MMGIDLNQIQLSEGERKVLAELAERTGKPWQEVLSQALADYRRQLGRLGRSCLVAAPKA